jgi:hypothetical protein
MPRGFMPHVWIAARGNYDWVSVIVTGIFKTQNDAVGAASQEGEQIVGALVNWGAGPLPVVGSRIVIEWAVPGHPGFYPIYHAGLPTRGTYYGKDTGFHPHRPVDEDEGPKPVRENPDVDYRRFHDVEPDRVIEGQSWVPGPLVYVGRGVDIGYNIIDRRSSKDGWYVHDFGHGVSIYRRAKSGEQPDKTLSSFPRELLVLGSNLGFTYEDDRGGKHEVKGSRSKTLCATPDKRKLAIVGPSGDVEFMAWGGQMRVVDWIYD